MIIIYNEIYGDLLSNTQKSLWKHNGDGAYMISSLNATLVGNVLTVTVPKSVDSALGTLSIENICKISTTHDDGNTFNSDEITL